MWVQLSRRAERALLDIRKSLTLAAGSRTALIWIERLTSLAFSLAEMPSRALVDAKLGRRRRLVLHPYLIVYDVRSDERVVIVRILDGRRDLPKLFRNSSAL